MIVLLRRAYAFAGIGITTCLGFAGQFMPIDKSWALSGAFFGIAFVWLIAWLIYQFKNKGKSKTIEPNDRKGDREEHKSKVGKPSRRENCERLAEIYLEYYDQFKNLIDLISRSSLEDYKIFLKDNEMLVGYKGSNKKQ